MGSIYKAKVSNVLPGMDAAFVDIGLEKNAFLYVGDILTDDHSHSHSHDAHDDKHKGRSSRRHTDPHAKIRDLVKPGQELLVQVVKAPRGTKGARVSTRVSLAGRYLVFMPDAANIGISRKIEEGKERDRLKKIGEKIRTDGGIIIRTEAEGRSESDLREDYAYLLKLWNQIQERARSAPPASIIHQELGLLFRVIRDMLSAEVYAVVVDSKPDHEKALELAQAISPRLADKVQLYAEKTPLFEAFGIEKEAERLLKPKIWMKSGGYLLIDETEALTSIDVNTGKFVGSTSLNETILKTNLEAVQEIVRHLRFRDLGGMIVLDFIDMASATDRQAVMRALDTALKNDRTRTKVAAISPLGLVEMTRKRTGENLTEALRDRCPYCEGRGNIQNPITTAVSVDRQFRDRAAKEDTEAYLLSMHPDVAVEFIGPHGAAIHTLEQDTRKAIYVRPDPAAHRERFAVGPADVPSMDKAMKGLKPGKTLQLTIVAFGSGDDVRPIAWHNGILVDVPNGGAHVGQTLPAKLTHVTRSYMVADLVGVPPVAFHEPPTVTPEAEPYTKAAVKADRDLMPTAALEQEFTSDSRGRDRHRRRDKSRDEQRTDETTEPAAADVAAETAEAGRERGGRPSRGRAGHGKDDRADKPTEAAETSDDARGHDEHSDAEDRDNGRRRRGRRRSRRDERDHGPAIPVALAEVEDDPAVIVSVAVMPPPPPVALAVQADGAEEEHVLSVGQNAGRSKRRWNWRRRRPRGESSGASTS